MPLADEAERLIQLARAALDRGDTVHHLQVDAAALVGGQSSWGSSDNALSPDESIGYFLSRIEEVGWRLEHADHVFVETGASTSQRLLGSGDGVVNRGLVRGFYVFRRSAAVGAEGLEPPTPSV